MIKNLVLAGGGTAGHVNPMLAVADRFRDQYPGLNFTVFGTKGGLEVDLVPRHGYTLSTIEKTALPRSIGRDLFTFPGRMSRATSRVQTTLRDMSAEETIVIGFGGYVSMPVYRVAKKLGLPLVIHEGNALAGLANKYGARFAQAVAVTFPQTKLAGAQVTGLPLLGKIAELAQRDASGRKASREKAAAAWNIDPNLPTLVVTGGSQGALSINTAVAPAAGHILDHGGQVVHITGRGKKAAVDKVVQGTYDSQAAKRYVVREYCHDMSELYSFADLVIGRAGAGTVCELTALGIAGVYVPYPVGNGEQKHNCAQVIAAGGGLLVQDKELSPRWVQQHAATLLFDDVRLAAMQRASRNVGIIDADQRIVNIAVQLLGGQ